VVFVVAAVAAAGCGQEERKPQAEAAGTAAGGGTAGGGNAQKAPAEAAGPETPRVVEKSPIEPATQPAGGADVVSDKEDVVPEFDPTPLESPEAGRKDDAASAPREPAPVQIVPLAAGADPFAALPVPVVPALEGKDPRGDTLRLGPEPLPEPGEIVAAFPPPGQALPPAKVEVPELKVVRHAPDGDADLVDAVTVSFSQPMVPLASLAELDQKAAPVTLSPATEGRFLWLGTDTVAFKPALRMPFATKYDVSVPAGVESALGKKLAEPYAFSFSTPRPLIVSMVPYDDQEELEPDTKLELTFNAKVDPEVVVKHVTVKTARGEDFPLEVVPTPPIAKPSTDPIEREQQEIDRSRRVVLKPRKPLPLGTHFIVEVDKDLTCIEGPLPAGKGQVFSFSTYYPPVIKEIRCWESDGLCYPGSPVTVRFNNRLKKQSVDERIKVSPAPADMALRVQGDSISIYGEFLPSTTYTVDVAPGIVDAHNQKTTAAGRQKLAYGRAYPFLRLVRSGLSVVEAQQPHDFMVSSMNLATAGVRMGVVTEQALPDAVEWATGWHSYEDAFPSSVAVKVSKNVPLQKEANRVDRTRLDLGDALGAGKSGFVLLDVRARTPRGLFSGWEEHRENALVQVTNLGLTAALSEEDVAVLVTRLDTGAPAAGVAVTLLHKETRRVVADAVTDELGIARLPGPKKSLTFGPYFLIAKTDGDASFLYLTGYTDMGYLSSYSYASSYEPDSVSAGFVFSERGLYRPAEQVHLTAVVRKRTTGPQGDLLPLPESERTLWYTVDDPQGNEAASGSLSLSPFGTGSFVVETRKDAPLGSYSVRVSGSGIEAHGSFRVEEYRTAEYKVSASFLDLGSNVLVKRKLDVMVTGNYFFGAPMANAQVEWSLQESGTSYTPPGNPGFTFTDVSKDRGDGWDYYEEWDGRRRPDSPGQSGSGALDASGTLRVPVVLDPGDIEEGPVSFTFEAEVYDQNRQSIAARATIVAHRSERCVGVSLDRSLIPAGEAVEVSGIVTRLNGERYESADVQITLFERRYENVEQTGESGEVEYSYRYKEVEAGSCVLKAGRDPGKCMLKVPRGGEYVARASTLDLGGRPARSAALLYAYGESDEPWMSESGDKVQVILDRPEYLPGDTVRILVQSPYAKARGLLVVAREGLALVQPLVVENGTATVDVKVDPRWLPSVAVHVGLVRGRTQEPGATRDDRGRPAWARGSGTIPVGRSQRSIRIQITPAAKAVDPGGTLHIDLAATDAAGAPVSAGVALMVVDEGVLSLIAYATPEPLAALYVYLADKVGLSDSRPMVVPRSKPKMEMERADDEAKKEESRSAGAGLKSAEMAPPAPGAMPVAAPRQAIAENAFFDKDGLAGEGKEGPKFTLREFFSSTAYFDGGLKTDESGRLAVDVKMPDNLTEFRVMAVAADAGNRFGSADTQVRTRKPLVARPALPRFLNLSDRFDAAVVVNNETGFDTQVVVRCAAANATVETPVQTVDIRAGEAKEVRFAARAGAPGPATFQFAAVALTERRDTDAVELTIPTLIPATSEAFATYGVVDEAVRQPLTPPADAIPGYGGLDVSLSSTALTGLQDAVSYLFDYPYECTEQICSRILPILALGDILADFEIGRAKSVEAARTLVREGIAKLLLHQREDGGFGYWPGSRESWLYVSAYAAMTLDIARSKGFEVSDYVMERATRFLEDRLEHPHDWEVTEYSSQAMAVLVLNRLGSRVPGHVERLYRLATGKPQPGERDTFNPLPLYARAWLMEAILLQNPGDSRGEELHRQLVNAAVETASAIHFSEGRTESMKLMMHSEDRTDAIVLNALLRVRKDDPMVEKVVRGLMRARVDGRWETTQSNAYALLAMSTYYELFEKEEPNFAARLWFGSLYLLGRTFKGRSMDIVKTRVPLDELLKQAAGDLVLAKKGPGRLYYRLGLKYAPANLKLDPEDRGFAVERTYLDEGGANGLTRREDGTWVARAGTYIRVKLRIVAPDNRYYVAVVDPLPAGFEAVNQALASSATSRLGGTSGESWQTGRDYWRWWRWNPWDFEEMRDDRVQVFCDRMTGGVYEYTYVARATTIGEFVVPPTRAEEMYEPETFGRSGSGKLVVEP